MKQLIDNLTQPAYTHSCAAKCSTKVLLTAILYVYFIITQYYLAAGTAISDLFDLILIFIWIIIILLLDTNIEKPSRLKICCVFKSTIINRLYLDLLKKAFLFLKYECQIIP